MSNGIENELIVIFHFLYVLKVEICIEFLYAHLNLSGFSVLRIGKCYLLCDHSGGSRNWSFFMNAAILSDILLTR